MNKPEFLHFIAERTNLSVAVMEIFGAVIDTIQGALPTNSEVNLNPLIAIQMALAGKIA